jgi:hypothetical protein
MVAKSATTPRFDPLADFMTARTSLNVLRCNPWAVTLRTSVTCRSPTSLADIVRFFSTCRKTTNPDHVITLQLDNEFAVYDTKDQNRFGGFHLGERTTRMTASVIVVIALGWIAIGLPALLSLL